jgi:hypothetical protein
MRSSQVIDFVQRGINDSKCCSDSFLKYFLFRNITRKLINTYGHIDENILLMNCGEFF